MTVTDQVIAQAQQLAGDSQDSELLNLLCRAADRNYWLSRNA